MEREDWPTPKWILEQWNNAKVKDIFDVYGLSATLEVFVHTAIDEFICGWDYGPELEPMWRGEYFVLLSETASIQNSIEAILNHDIDTLIKVAPTQWKKRMGLWSYLYGHKEASEMIHLNRYYLNKE